MHSFLEWPITFLPFSIVSRTSDSDLSFCSGAKICLVHLECMQQSQLEDSWGRWKPGAMIPHTVFSWEGWSIYLSL
jgi:hypothetical protein